MHHTCTPVHWQVHVVHVKWHFIFTCTNTDGISMMSYHIFNTYYNKYVVLHVPNRILAKLFYFFYLPTDYTSTSLSMRVALESGFFLKFLRVAFSHLSPGKNSWIVKASTMTNRTQLNRLPHFNSPTTRQTFVLMRLKCPFDMNRR